MPDGKSQVMARYLFHKKGIDAHKDMDLPWAALTYGLNSRRYNVLHMDHPDNPRPAAYSAYRTYGRFGTFRKANIKAGETLTLRYRIWVVEGKMPQREEMSEKYAGFVNSPKVEVLNCAGPKD